MLYFQKFFTLTVFLLILISSQIAFAQNYQFQNVIGKFNDASSFYITSGGILYVTDAGTDEIYKIDTLGNVLKSTGGYGWDNGQFDNPADVFANPLSVYACDKNNHRVERFDKDLNFVSSLYTRNSDTTEERFGYPLSCALSQQGDLYILDSENKRIIKFNLFGNFVQNFGGFDAGSFSLNNPLQLAVANNNNIFVLDNNYIVVFDQYGNGITKIKTKENLKSIRIIFNNLTLTTEDSVFYANLNLPDFTLSKINLFGINKINDITSSLIFNKTLYVLTKKDILIFKAQ
jgi:DNA-binding beta-propeller fold protein YncE